MAGFDGKKRESIFLEALSELQNGRGCLAYSPRGASRPAALAWLHMLSTSHLTLSKVLGSLTTKSECNLYSCQTCCANSVTRDRDLPGES